MKRIFKFLGIIALIIVIGFTAGCGGNGAGGGGSGGGKGGTGNSTHITSPNVGKLVHIPAGTFMMGSPDTEPNHSDDETQHSVTLTKAFYMSEYQVTQKQWTAVMGSLPTSLDDTYDKGDNYPVYYVSWYDAVEFCNKLSMKEGLTPAYRINGKTNPDEWGTIPWDIDAIWNAVTIVDGSTGYRLPKEAQWEYACRAGTTTAYNTGATISDNTGWYEDNSGDKTHEVGKKPANAWGLYDMHGNVFEWCWDWYGSYTTTAQNDPTGAVSGTERVGRGGSFKYYGVDILRSAYRDELEPNSQFDNVGVRLVRP